ncbi:MAG: ABC transporter permease [Candidatus Omnitrophica bacterium]|nr:ABC transporter permease [Candidatus Omnitrophota bacterium]
MIDFKNIHKTYKMGDTEVRALNNVSLKISAGEFVAIMGPSGSGKSTLMHVLGLLDRPDAGTYVLDNKEIKGLSDEKLAVIRNQLIGFVFQQFHLLSRLTALDNAELPLIYAGKRHLREKARQKIELVGLKDRISHRPNELSGGQQQRVAIARALVNDPPIILADEPTGNLDSKSKEEILNILKQLNQEGKTVIIVTHEREIAEHAKRIIFMRDGQIVSDEANSGKAFIANPVVSDSVEFDKKSAASTGAKFVDYLREACFAIWSHKLRSFLSILGILIGVGAVIAMLALGQGAKAAIEKQLAGLGSNLLVLRAGSPKLHGVALESGTVTRFTFQDVDALRNLSDEIVRVSPSVSGRGQIVYSNKNWNTQVEGVDVDYEYMRSFTPEAGRFFNASEVRMREKVALLGTTVARELFGEANPIGEVIKINLINFQVIGVLPEKGASTFRDQDDVILIPVTTAMYRLFGKQYVDYIFIECRDPQAMDALSESISTMIIKLHRLRKDNEDSFEVRNMADIKKTLEATTKTMSLLLGAIAAISLFVGGIGIMNIMLVSVTERTREIGLRKAIGANNRDILVQFLIEAVLMSVFGGLGGILLGAGVSALVTFIAGWSMIVSASSVILATVFSLIVGVVFGLWPAKQASRLDPIEALRYE